MYQEDYAILVHKPPIRRNGIISPDSQIFWLLQLDPPDYDIFAYNWLWCTDVL